MKSDDILLDSSPCLPQREFWGLNPKQNMQLPPGKYKQKVIPPFARLILYVFDVCV